MVLSISKQERTWKKIGMLRMQADGQWGFSMLLVSTLFRVEITHRY